MALCPDCQRTLVDEHQCSMCGWETPTAAGTRDRRCAHVENGMRCIKSGTVSQNRRGDGLWYCHKHEPKATRLGSGSDWRDQIINDQLHKGKYEVKK